MQQKTKMRETAIAFKKLAKENLPDPQEAGSSRTPFYRLAYVTSIQAQDQIASSATRAALRLLQSNHFALTDIGRLNAQP